jgi:hypothetical protein
MDMGPHCASQQAGAVLFQSIAVTVTTGADRPAEVPTATMDDAIIEKCLAKDNYDCNYIVICYTCISRKEEFKEGLR